MNGKPLVKLGRVRDHGSHKALKSQDDRGRSNFRPPGLGSLPMTIYIIAISIPVSTTQYGVNNESGASITVTVL